MSPVETITVLFTDLVGSTGLATRVGPGAAEELRREHFALLRTAIDETGGREVKNVGDGLMVVFQSSSSAVACAILMQQHLERRNRRSDEQLMVRIGVSAGEADVEEGDYFGPPVVEAARLCDASAGGQVLCGELVRMMARNGHAFRSVGELELKGLPEPFATYEIQWEPLSGAAGALPLPPRLREVPPVGYVGRREEREKLALLLRQAEGGDRRIAFISGEPGMGKTRLATHLANEAHGEGAAVLYGRCDEDLVVPYAPWVEALGHYVRKAPDEVLAAHAERHGGELARLVPDGRRRVAEYPPPTDTDPETERYLLFAAVAGLLEEASRDGPLVLILDDLHWADKPSLSLLLHLVAHGGEMRLLVVATYRDSDLTRSHPLAELLADLHREDGVSRVPLSGLEEEDVIAIMEAAAGHELQSEGLQLAHAIVRETDGNPFYVAELLRHLLEAGALVQGEDGRFRIEGRIEELGLPQSVREVVGRRVERLSEESRRALSVAAVIGREFDVALLAAVLGTDEDTLLDLLDEALEASVVNESSESVGRFSFAHALINRTLYDELSRTRRARLHARVAEAIEASCGDDPGARVAELAHHLVAAARPEDPARAIDYARRAGERALAELAPDEAVRWFEQALELEEHTSVGDVVMRCDLLFGLAEAQRQAGDAANRDTFLMSSRLAEELRDAERAARAALANSRGFNRVFGEVDSELIAALQRALELGGMRDRATSARLLARQAAELCFDPDHERRWALADQALAIARETGDVRTLADVLPDYDYATIARNDTPTKRALQRERASLLKELADPVASVFSALHGCYVCVLEGDVDGAAEDVRRARETVEALGQPSLRWMARYFGFMVDCLRGDLTQAERTAAEAAEIGGAAGQADAPMVFAAQLLTLRLYQGRADEVLTLVEQAVEANPGISSWRAELALAYAYAGRLAKAEALVAEAAATGLAVIPWDQVRTGGLVAYAEAAFIAEVRSAAAVLYEALEATPDDLVANGALASGSIRMYLGMLAALLGRHECADEHFERACRLHDRQGIRLFGAQGRVAWAEALARRGDTARAREEADRALAVAREHGYGLIERRATAVLEHMGAPAQRASA